MSRQRTRTGAWYFVGFAAVTFVLAGGVSYLADPALDGLESVVRDGCTTVPTPEGERLSGSCLEQYQQQHAFAEGFFADYAISGDDRLTGVAGVVGVALTSVVAGGLFSLLRRSGRSGGAE